MQIYLLGIPDACPENGEDKCYASANTGKSFFLPASTKKRSRDATIKKR
jgi:hypothetical protein